MTRKQLEATSLKIENYTQFHRRLQEITRVPQAQEIYLLRMNVGDDALDYLKSRSIQCFVIGDPVATNERITTSVIPMYDRGIVLSMDTEVHNLGGQISFVHLDRLITALERGVSNLEELLFLDFKDSPDSLSPNTIAFLKDFSQFLIRFRKDSNWFGTVVDQRRFHFYERMLDRLGITNVTIDIALENIDNLNTLLARKSGDMQIPSSVVARWIKARRATKLPRND
jgi:hypothetical protein